MVALTSLREMEVFVLPVLVTPLDCVGSSMAIAGDTYINGLDGINGSSAKAP
jgi:hypothetical protein